MVRATFAGFSTAMSAIQASQKRLDITGQNLANANTVGYTRQQLQVSSLNYTNPVSHYMNSSYVGVGFGVHMEKVTQIRDPYLDMQYRGQIQKSGYTDAMQTSLDRLAEYLDESQIDGIRSAFDDIQATLQAMSDTTDVNDAVFEAELRTRMQALSNKLNEAAREIDKAAMEEFNHLDGTGTSEQGAVQRVNDILQQIGKLNRQIKQNQIMGQPSLELMDDRNVLLDELASYIPIEVSYYKDAEHDGLDGLGVDDGQHDGEKYHLDSSGNIIMKKEWPDDLRVTMSYVDAQGITQKLVLVEGTVGQGDENYGQVSIPNSDDIRSGKVKPGDVELKFSGFEYTTEPDKYGQTKKDVDMAQGRVEFPDGSGSIQAGLDMLWKDGKTPGIADVRGYDFYMNQLDNLAKSFAGVMNEINKEYGGGALLASKDGAADITASNIGISEGWVNGTVHVAEGNADDNPNATILDMLEAMQTTYPIKGGNLGYLTVKPDLDNNTFSNFMNHTSTILANDSYSNTNSLKTNMTVLNGIQNSRDSVSGVSFNEEAANMMMHMSAYNAASRLMTTLDQALDVLINGTGVVGR